MLPSQLIAALILSALCLAGVTCCIAGFRKRKNLAFLFLLSLWPLVAWMEIGKAQSAPPETSPPPPLAPEQHAGQPSVARKELVSVTSVAIVPIPLLPVLLLIVTGAFWLLERRPPAGGDS